MVNGVVDTIVKSRAVKIYISNIMTQPGETDNYTISDHLKAIIKHSVNLGVVDYVVVNSEDAPGELLEDTKKIHILQFVILKYSQVGKVTLCLKLKILSTRDTRHDPLKLAHAINFGIIIWLII